MKVEFTASDGGACVVLIHERNLQRMRKKWPDLKIRDASDPDRLDSGLE